MNFKVLKEFGRNPHVDWLCILFIGTVLAIYLGASGFSLYNDVISGTIKRKNPPPSSASFTKLDEKVISTVLQRYEAKAAASEKTRAGYTGAPDPSI